MMAAQMPEGRPTEFAFTEADRNAIAEIVYAEAGIVMSQSKGQLIYARVAPRVRHCGLDTVADYVALIQSHPEERMLAIDALTTNHTSFFREAHHFEHFLADVWPGLETRLAQGGRVRIWSAACSSGEEPYSLLMAMLGKDRAAAQRTARADLKLLATDLSTNALAAASAARYPSDAVRGVPADVRHWMVRKGNVVEIDPLLRRAIAFRRLNLLQAWPMKRQFDAIFCRNVMIYFDEPTKARLQKRLADQLVPGGMLYIGHSERLSDSVADAFTCIGRTAYRKLAA